MRTLAVEGTVFWLIVSAVLIGAVVTPANIPLMVGSLVTVVVYLIIAYFCWTLRRWSYIAAVVLALITAVGGVVLLFSFGAANVEEALDGTVLFLIPQLLIIFFSLRAYRELAAG